MNKIDIQRIIEQHPNYKDKLFCRGFLFTDDVIVEEAYPFYGLWKRQKFGKYTLFVSSKQQYFYHEKGKKAAFIFLVKNMPVEYFQSEKARRLPCRLLHE